MSDLAIEAVAEAFQPFRAETEMTDPASFPDAREPEGPGRISAAPVALGFVVPEGIEEARSIAVAHLEGGSTGRLRLHRPADGGDRAVPRAGLRARAGGGPAGGGGGACTTPARPR